MSFSNIYAKRVSSSMFPSFNFFMCPEDGTTIYHEDRKEEIRNFKYEKMLKFTQFCNLLQSSRKKSAFLKITAQAF